MTWFIIFWNYAQHYVDIIEVNNSGDKLFNHCTCSSSDTSTVLGFIAQDTTRGLTVIGRCMEQRP